MINERTWKEGEDLARLHMKQLGYKIIINNFHDKIVELDIVAEYSKLKQAKKLKQEYRKKMRKASSVEERHALMKCFANEKKELKNILIITEVKARKTDEFGTGLESITKRKRQKLFLGAKLLSSMKKYKDHVIRFDVAGVDNGAVTYVENAFDVKN